MGRKLPTDWSSRRKQVYDRDDFRCGNCGRYHGMDGMNPHAHHIRPRERGGTHKLRNLVTVCDRCHEQIHQGVIPNPSHDNPIDRACEAMRGIGWQVQERVQRDDLIDLVKTQSIPSMDSLQAQLNLVNRAEENGFSPRSLSDIIRDLESHSEKDSSDCNDISA